MRPWRDIYSLEVFKARTSRWDRHGPRGPFTHLYDLIKAYHLIPKTEYLQLANRFLLLMRIRTKASEVLLARQDKKGGRPDKPAADPTRSSVDHVLWSLRQRAGYKSAYLEGLRVLYQEGGELHGHSDQAGMRKLLEKRKFLTLESGSLSSQLGGGLFLEALDPGHRMYLFEESKNKDGSIDRLSAPPMTEAHELPMSFIFIEWLGSKSSVPFFLWLEDQPICTGERDDTRPATKGAPKVLSNDGYHGQFRPGDSALSPVQYPDIARQMRLRQPVYELTVEDSRLKYRDLAGSDAFTIFDTKILRLDPPVKEKEPKGESKEPKVESKEPIVEGAGKGCAFVEDGRNALFAGQHITGRFHHSSLSGGKKVRCAGMIRVADGKVMFVSNNSGHYRPLPGQLYAFVLRLQADNVLGKGCVVQWLAPPGGAGSGTGDVKTFLSTMTSPS